MHRAQNIIKAIYYAYDLQNLYFRIDLSRSMKEAEEFNFKVVFVGPEGYEGQLKIVPEKGAQFQLTNKDSPGDIKDGAIAADSKIIEFSVPWIQFPRKTDTFEWVLG